MFESYKIVSSQIVSENLDNETIVINLNSGVYYSLNPLASLIWQGIEQEIKISNILTKLNSHFDTSFDLKADVLNFISSLQQEDLIIGVEASCSEKEFDLNPVIPNYIAPAFDKYEDMQEMLLADPIHDVEQDGWPNVKPK